VNGQWRPGKGRVDVTAALRHALEAVQDLPAGFLPTPSRETLDTMIESPVYMRQAIREKLSLEVMV